VISIPTRTTERSEITRRGIVVHVVAPGSVQTNVARNALTSYGVARGESDRAIENGYTASDAAERILSAVERGKREIMVARGVERLAVQMRLTRNGLRPHRRCGCSWLCGSARCQKVRGI
jgi:dehydrogenase/reductase SDR family member 7B